MVVSVIGQVENNAGYKVNRTNIEIAVAMTKGQIVFLNLIGSVYIATDALGSAARFSNILDPTQTGQVDNNGVFTLDAV
jgi:hypothetical protein